MSETRVVLATKEHVDKMKNKIRFEDRRECWCLGKISAPKALELSFEATGKAWTALDDNDEPILMFGVTVPTMLGTMGIPWLLGTKRMEKVKREFIIRSRHFVEEMLEIRPYLENYVDARNELSLRWLKWCGFSVEAIPRFYGWDGDKFHRFWLRKEVKYV